MFSSCIRDPKGLSTSNGPPPLLPNPLVLVQSLQHYWTHLPPISSSTEDNGFLNDFTPPMYNSLGLRFQKHAYRSLLRVLHHHHMGKRYLFCQECCWRWHGGVRRLIVEAYTWPYSAWPHIDPFSCLMGCKVGIYYLLITWGQKCKWGFSWSWRTGWKG